MRNDVERYESGQLYLLKTGKFILITEVEPETKLNKGETNRRCYCKLGHCHVKGEEMKNDNIVIIENGPNGQIISIDVSESAAYSIQTLRSMEAYYVGKLSKDKLKHFNNVLSDYLDRN